MLNLIAGKPNSSPLEMVGLDNRDFFRPWNGNVRSKCYLCLKSWYFPGPAQPFLKNMLFFGLHSWKGLRHTVLYGLAAIVSPFCPIYQYFKAYLLKLSTKDRIFSEREDERVLLPSRIHVLLVPSSHWRTTTMFRHTHSQSTLYRKSDICIPRNKNSAASFPIPTFMYRWVIYIFPGIGLQQNRQTDLGNV